MHSYSSTDSNRNTKNRKINTAGLVQMSMFAAILSLSAYISITLPIPGSPHLTMQNFVVLLIALLFPAREAFFTILIWLLLGCFGVPVFIGGLSGPGYLLSGYGGYSLAFLLPTVILPYIRGNKYHFGRYFFCALLGSFLLINGVGMTYLAFATKITWKTAFFTGFLPFVPLDFVKAMIAAKIIPSFRKALHR